MSGTPHSLHKENPQHLPSAHDMRLGIVVSKWNREVTENLLDGALQCLVKQGADANNILVHWVPGSFELPLAAAQILREKEMDAVLCLGCVIQGETRHFEFICQAVAQGIMQVGLQFQKPVVFGVLTTQNLDQAMARSGGSLGNKGIEAAVTALEMVSLSRSLSQEK